MIAYVLCPCCWSPGFRGLYSCENQVQQASEMAAVVSTPPQTTQLTQAETPRIPFSARSETQKLEGVTQVHAAAVNGDKQTLSRLLAQGSSSDIDIGDQFGRSPLMYCVLADRLECAEMLLKSGGQVNLTDKGGRTALHWAAHKGNVRLMKLLLSRGADCRMKDNEGQTALHLCTRHKVPKCMALLLRQLTPGEIDDQDKNKRTALHWAASYGNLEHVKMLIKQGSNIGIPDTEGKTPLHWAASSRDREAVSCVKLILETTPSVIYWQDYEGRTALHLAVADGNISIVNVLTSVTNCNVSALDNVFRTPLHWAAVLGHSKIVELLLNSDADSTSSDANGATPLHYAAQNNYDETVHVFLSHNCTDEPDLEGRTAFMWAAGKGADDVIRVFLAHNVDIHQEDKTGATALHAAALSGHSSTVKLLLDNNARLEVTDQAKHTPLFRACEMGQMDVVQTLIEYGARVDVLDQDGRSALHWAALGGHAYICQMLIKYGVHPNIRDHSARTPLHCAAYGGYVNCMSALMEHGAEPNSQDKEGMTCLHWACSKGHLDAVKLLVEHAAFPNHMEFTEDRYTPLDYALMGEHHDVAQYMIEQGALSITGMQDIAAQKIQSAFKGYRVRKAFIERKKLLMKHEQLKKEAARKRAAEEGKKSEDTSARKTDVSIPASSQQNVDQQQEQHHQHQELQQTQQTTHLSSDDHSCQMISETQNEDTHHVTIHHEPSTDTKTETKSKESQETKSQRVSKLDKTVDIVSPTGASDVKIVTEVSCEKHLASSLTTDGCDEFDDNGNQASDGKFLTQGLNQGGSNLATGGLAQSKLSVNSEQLDQGYQSSEQVMQDVGKNVKIVRGDKIREKEESSARDSEKDLEKSDRESGRNLGRGEKQHVRKSEQRRRLKDEVNQSGKDVSDSDCTLKERESDSSHRSKDRLQVDPSTSERSYSSCDDSASVTSSTQRSEISSKTSRSQKSRSRSRSSSQHSQHSTPEEERGKKEATPEQQVKVKVNLRHPNPPERMHSGFRRQQQEKLQQELQLQQQQQQLKQQHEKSDEAVKDRKDGPVKSKSTMKSAFLLNQ